MRVKTAWQSENPSALGWLFFASGWFAVFSFAALPISTTFTDIFLALAIICLIFSGNLKEKFSTIIDNPTAVLFLVFFAWYGVAASYSSAPSHDITKALLKNTKLLYGALLVPIFLQEKWRNYALNALMAVMGFILLLAYLKWIGLVPMLDSYQEAIVFKNHIDFSFLMAIFSYLLLRKIFDSPKYQWFWGAWFLLASAYTLLVNVGRTGYIVYGVLMLLFFWQRFSHKGVLLALLSVMVIGGATFCFSHSFQARITQVFSESAQYNQGNVQTSVGLRMNFYKNALSLIREHPLLGSGTGSLSSRYKTIEPNASLATNNVHNEYLNVTIQLGILGLLFLLYFFITIYRTSYQLPQYYAELAQAVVLTIAVGSLLNSWLLDTLEGHFFAMMMALCFAVKTDASSSLFSRV